MPLRRSDNLHLLPIVGKLAAAFETNHVSPGQSCSLGTARGPAKRNWEAVARMPTAENRIEQSCNHYSPPQNPVRLLQASGIFSALALEDNYDVQVVRFQSRRKGFEHSRNRFWNRVNLLCENGLTSDESES